MNLRLVGGRDNPFKNYSLDRQNENPALEPEEEEFGFPYRFTNQYVDAVEEIYNSINNGDYEGARESFRSQNIGTIFGEDMLRLRNDLQNGMELDTEEEQFIKDLRDMVVGIRKELEQHFGKRMRGGAIPERITDTITNDERFARRYIRYMTRLVDYITELVDEPQTEQVVSETRKACRILNNELDYFDTHFSEIATREWLNENDLLVDYNNIVSQAVEANQFLNLDYGSSERK